jgi:RNase P/RNase MRP subunit p29
MDSSVSPKDEIWFLRVCHHISNVVYLGVRLVYFTLQGQDVGRKSWKYGGEVHVFNLNSARYVGLKSAVLLHQKRMLCTVEGDHARAAQIVKTSTVQELNASRVE